MKGTAPYPKEKMDTKWIDYWVQYSVVLVQHGTKYSIENRSGVHLQTGEHRSRVP